jgi:hypothetical protein
MKRSSLITAICCAISIIIGFAYGYYRGYHDRSRIITGLNLSVNEFYYSQLEQNNLEKLRNSIKTVIYSQAQSLRILEKSPLRHFTTEFVTAKSGDISNELEKADQITKDLIYSPVPPTFEGISLDTK